MTVFRQWISFVTSHKVPTLKLVCSKICILKDILDVEQRQGGKIRHGKITIPAKVWKIQLTRFCNKNYTVLLNKKRALNVVIEHNYLSASLNSLLWFIPLNCWSLSA